VTGSLMQRPFYEIARHHVKRERAPRSRGVHLARSGARVLTR